MVTDYLQKTGRTCRYSYSKLKNVLYLVSAEHLKDVHIDNGEAYIDGLTELPLRINGFDIQFTEETSLDERYKFQKTLTLSMHGYVNYKAFGGRYYAIIESEDGTFFMVNVDFPSRITHTFNLSQNTNQTDFTFACLSNFPTLRLVNEFEAVSPVCLGLNVYGIDKLQMVEKENALLDVVNKTVKTSVNLKNVEFLGRTCSFQEVYDGNKVTDTITFNIAFDNYKPSWQWNLLEFLENKYVAIITPKGNDNKYYVGFNFGLSPSYTIQTSTEAGASDIITVTLVETSIYGSTAAVDWTDEQTTETQWRYIKNVGGTICYECIGLGRARYLVKQEVNAFGTPTGNYQVMEGYESQYPNFHIVGTFSDDVEFDNSDCKGEACQITTTIPQTITFTSTTSYSYTLRTTCNWNITNVPSYINVYPSSGNANTTYTVTISNMSTPGQTPLESEMQINCCMQSRTVNLKVQNEQSCISPITKYANCNEQSVVFIYDGNCQINVISIDPQLTYTTQNNRLLVNIPKNDTYSAHTWNIGVSGCSCPSSGVSIHIVQDRIYDEWINEGEYMCESGNSYAIERRYTATTYGATSYTRTDETRKGSLIQSGDTRCGSVQTKWEWDNESYTCEGGNKLKLIFEYISYDDGSTWAKTGNVALGEVVESASTWCEGDVTYSWVLTDNWVCDFAPPFEGKFKATYSDSHVESAECDSSSEIKENEIDKANLVSVEVGNCATSIGQQVFYGCSSLTSVTMPNSVTSIGTSAFRDCSGLTSIVIPSGVTSISQGAFNSCTSLTSVTMPSSVAIIGIYAFYSCTSLTSITIPNSVDSIGGYAFRDCTSLRSIAIPNSVTSIGSAAFRNCYRLTSVTIPDSVTSIGTDAFRNCYGLTSITVESTTPATLGNYAFNNTNNCPIYVPSGSVDAYKTAWPDYSSRITAISS